MADATQTAGSMKERLGLHTWTLDTTPLAQVLRIIDRTGWNAVELRRIDFVRAAEVGHTQADVIALVRGSGVPVAAVGVEPGWMYADGEELKRLLGVFTEQCRAAEALGAAIVMSPVDRGTGPLAQAAGRIREVGALAGQLGRMLKPSEAMMVCAAGGRSSNSRSLDLALKTLTTSSILPRLTSRSRASASSLEIRSGLFARKLAASRPFRRA